MAAVSIAKAPHVHAGWIGSDWPVMAWQEIRAGRWEKIPAQQRLTTVPVFVVPG